MPFVPLSGRSYIYSWARTSDPLINRHSDYWSSKCLFFIKFNRLNRDQVQLIGLRNNELLANS